MKKKIDKFILCSIVFFAAPLNADETTLTVDESTLWLGRAKDGAHGKCHFFSDGQVGEDGAKGQNGQDGGHGGNGGFSFFGKGGRGGNGGDAE